jgi:hypothetical protein
MIAARLGGAVVIAVAFAASHALAGGIQPARPNALLVVDENNQRVLRVALADGEVTVFSPPEGAGTNLLTSARGIGVGSDGSIVVANYFEATLVEIDPATGAQFPVAGLLSGPLAIGTLPRDVALNPRAPAPGFLPTLGVASQGALHQVVRNALDTTGSLLALYPSPYDPHLGEFVVPALPENDDPLDYVVATGTDPALLWYDGLGDAFTPIWTPLGVDAITGLDAPRGESPFALVAAYRSGPCEGGSHGLMFFPTLAEAGSVDIPSDCPGPVAYDARTDTTFFVDVKIDPKVVIGVYGVGGGGLISWDERATLPSGTSARDMALARVPEPGVAGLGAAALAALAVRARGQRR